MVGDITFQKMYGLYGLKHHIVDISGDVTDAGRMNKRTNNKQRQGLPLLIMSVTQLYTVYFSVSFRVFGHRRISQFAQNPALEAGISDIFEIPALNSGAYCSSQMISQGKPLSSKIYFWKNSRHFVISCICVFVYVYLCICVFGSWEYQF